MNFILVKAAPSIVRYQFAKTRDVRKLLNEYKVVISRRGKSQMFRTYSVKNRAGMPIRLPLLHIQSEILSQQVVKRHIIGGVVATVIRHGLKLRYWVFGSAVAGGAYVKNVSDCDSIT